tara:strand:- start:481 stop:762 length:282 start_codon:yes stop_codon:yes gene_type:complete
MYILKLRLNARKQSKMQNLTQTHADYAAEILVAFPELTVTTTENGVTVNGLEKDMPVTYIFDRVNCKTTFVQANDTTDSDDDSFFDLLDITFN